MLILEKYMVFTMECRNFGRHLVHVVQMTE